MKLNERQRTVLHTVVSRGRIAADELDGRTCRALVERGLAVERGRWIEATSAGEAALGAPLPSRKRRGRGGAPEARAEAIRRAADQLERALPLEAEVLVGRIMAAASDVVSGFRAYAEQARRAPPSKP